MNQKPLRVLLVDDEVNFCKHLKKFLETQHNFEVAGFYTGAEAQRNLKESRGAYDVALVDELLEGEISGSELLQWIKGRYPQIEVIVYTAWGMDNALNALRAGAYRYLTKPFNTEELALQMRHAAEVAQLRSAAREKDMLSNLMQVSTALLSGREEEEILKMTLQAIHAIGFDRVRLYELQENGAILRARSHVGMEDSFLQASWKAMDDSLLQVVLADPQVHVFHRQPGEVVPHEALLDKRDVDEWICAPLVVDGQMIGKLSADKKYSKAPITEAEKGPIALFTSMAALAIENNRLLRSTRQRAEALEKLRKNTLAITANLDRETLLQTIIQGAVELLGARRGGIYEYHPGDQSLTVIADWGHGESTCGRTLKAGEGLAGRLVVSGEPYLLVNDYAEWPGRSPQYDPEEFRAVVEAPMLWEGQPTGVLYVEDAEGRAFTENDARLLSSFADYAAIALEQSRRMTELTTTRDGFARLIESSFDGIISTDLPGRITEFNSQAEKILEYSRAEIIGRPVQDLYADPNDAYAVGKLLKTCVEGRLTDHPIHLKTKSGQEVPVRLSVSRLFDARGQRAGTVGYFKDTRYIQKVERHRQLLLEANEAVARAKTQEEGLGALAEFMTIGCHSTFGAIYLVNEDGGLQIKAAHPVDRQPELTWSPFFEGQGIPSSHPLFRLAASKGEPIVLNDQDPEAGYLLEEIAGNVRLDRKLHSALIIPLVLGGEARGMCVLGEMRSWQRQPFDEAEIILVESLTKDAATLLEKMQLQELTTRQLAESERQKRLWEALAQSLRYIQPARERDQLQQEITNQLADLMEYPYACLLIHHPLAEQLEIVRVRQLAESLKGSRAPAQSEPFKFAGQSDEILYVDEIIDRPWRAVLFGEAPVRSALFIPFQSAGELVAVLALGDTRPRGAWDTDKEILKRFSTQAVTALQTSELIGSEKRKVAQLMLLHRISDYIQRPTEDLIKIYDAALTGVTAIYGLGFNRAAILLTDPQREKLIGEHAIGHVDQHSAEVDWASSMQQGLDDVNRYLDMLEHNQIASTPMDRQIRRLEIDLRSPAGNPFLEVMSKGKAVSLNDEQVARLPENFLQAFQPGASFTVAPLIARREVIGLLVADNKFTGMPVSEGLLDNLMTFANTIAIAVDAAQMIKEMQRTREAFEKVAQVMTLGNFEVTKKLLVQSTRQVTHCDAVVLYTLDETTGILDYPPTMDNVSFPERAKQFKRVEPESVVYKMLEQEDLYVVENLNADPYFNISRFSTDEKIQAVVAVPLQAYGNKKGVMFVNYRKPLKFSQADRDNIKLFAHQAAIAVHNAKLFENLEKTKGMVGARQALAWMGMVSNTFRHSLENNAQTILANLEMIDSKATDLNLGDAFQEQIELIQRVANEVRQMPITAPLSEEEGVEPFSLSELLRERLGQKRSAFAGVTIRTRFANDESTTVKADRQWIRRALDILLENAVEAMQEAPEKTLTVEAACTGSRVEVRVSDTGKGIDDEIRKILFREIVRKDDREKGLGVGLLMASTIFQTYLGDVECDKTGPDGTTMLCWLPAIQPIDLP